MKELWLKGPGEFCHRLKIGDVVETARLNSKKRSNRHADQERCGASAHSSSTFLTPTLQGLEDRTAAVSATPVVAQYQVPATADGGCAKLLHRSECKNASEVCPVASQA